MTYFRQKSANGFLVQMPLSATLGALGGTVLSTGIMLDPKVDTNTLDRSTINNYMIGGLLGGGLTGAYAGIKNRQRLVKAIADKAPDIYKNDTFLDFIKKGEGFIFGDANHIDIVKEDLKRANRAEYLGGGMAGTGLAALGSGLIYKKNKEYNRLHPDKNTRMR